VPYQSLHVASFSSPSRTRQLRLLEIHQRPYKGFAPGNLYTGIVNAIQHRLQIC